MDISEIFACRSVLRTSACHSTLVELTCVQAALKKFLATTKKKMVAQSRSHKQQSGHEMDEEFERRKEQWQVRC